MSRRRRLYIFDLDGTAIKSEVDALPSTALINVVHKFHRYAYLSAATGRSWVHAKNTIEALRLKTPCIISGGTQIIDPHSEKIIWSRDIAPDAIFNILDVASRFDKQVAYVNDLFTSDQKAASDFEDLSSANTMYVFGIKKDELEEVVRRINAHTETRAVATRSWSDSDVIDLHITNKNATKGKAVNALLKSLSVEEDETVAIGDGLNDIDLFSAVGSKIAMGNAEDELKVHSDKVIGSIFEDGLAQYFSKEVGGYE